jgi:cohesin complex subunit SA-1/2
MEVETRPNADAPGISAGASRRSGRVVRAPEKYAAESLTAPAKRQRPEEFDNENGENESPVEDEDEDAMGDDDDELEEVDDAAPTKRKGRKRIASQSAGGKKPAAKKPKINGDIGAANDNVTSLARRPKKTVRIDVGERSADDLYGMSDLCHTDGGLLLIHNSRCLWIR